MRADEPINAHGATPAPGREPLLRLWLWESAQALRSLIGTPRFSVPALLSLALGIGASTAVLALFSAVLLRPLRFAAERELVGVAVQTASVAGSGTDIFGMSPPFTRELAELRSVFTSFSAFKRGEVTLTEGGQPRYATAARTTPEFFDTLRPEVALGRTFTRQGSAPDGLDVVVLRHGYWLSALGGAPIVGRSVVIDGTPKTVVGIVDDDAAYPSWADVWLPLAFSADDYERRYLVSYTGVARLVPGLPLADAQQRLREDALQRNIVSGDGTLCVAKLEALRERLVGANRDPVTLLAVAVAGLFLLACANVAALLLTRATVMSHTLAVRRALGAGPAALLRQCAFEVLTLTLVSALAGLGLAAALLHLANGEWRGLEATPARLDLRVVVGLVGLSLAGGLFVGVTPALHTLRVHPMDSLRGSGRSSSGRAARRVRALLVALQVAVSVVLLGGAGVILRSIEKLRDVDPGFDRTAVGVRVLLPPPPPVAGKPWFVTPHERAAPLARAVRERAERIPGVLSAAVASSLPFSRQVMFGFEVAPPARDDQCHALLQLVTPEYFGTLGIRLVSGRAFDDADARTGGLDQEGGAIIVNRTFAKDVLGTEDALGHRVSWFRKTPDGSPVWLQIVGVAEDVLDADLTRRVDPLIYTPFTGLVRPHGDSFAVVVKSSGDPQATLAALQAAVRDVDASVPIYEAEVIGDLTEGSYWQRSALALALSCFALTALVLAAIGLFGVTSYNVSERLGEIGIRRALGATRASILRMILSGTAGVVALGLALGMAVAWAARALLGSFVFGITSVDPLTYVVVCLGVALFAMLAALAAARGATRVEPSRTLTDA